MKKQSILIIQTAFLGDLILTTPFLNSIRNKYPNSKIAIVVAKGTESVLDGNPIIDQIFSLDKKKAKKNIGYFFSFIKVIRSLEPDIVYSPHFSYRSTLISYFSGAKIRIGYKESGFSFLHTQRISRPINGIHEVDKLFSLIFDSEPDYPQGRERRPYLFPSKSTESSALFKLQTVISNNNGYIVISPSSVWETKKYPFKGFSELIRLILTLTRYSVVLTGAPIDRELNMDILVEVYKLLYPNKINNYAEGEDNLNFLKIRLNRSFDWQSYQNRILDLAGETSLSEMAVVIQRSIAVVTNDSSPVHYASAFNKPTVMVYGATVPDFGYYGLMDQLEIAEIQGLYCRPCGIHGSNQCPEKHFRCMREQSPESIFLLLKKLLEIKY